MLPPYVYEQARVNATEHVQVDVLGVARPAPTADNGAGAFGKCRVDARVARVFRGRLKVGDAVVFDVSCMTPRAEIPVGGTIWTDMETLGRARVLEGFFNRDGARLDVARDQIYIVPATRPTPYCAPPTFDCVLPVPAPPVPAQAANPLVAWWQSLFPKP